MAITTNALVLPMSLGDIFDRLMKTVARTLTRTSVLALIAMLPTSVLFAFALDMMLSSLADLIPTTIQPQMLGLDMLDSLIGPAVFLAFAALLQIVSILATTVAITIVAAEEMNGRRIRWQDAMHATLSVRFLRALGQYALQVLAVFGLFIIPFCCIFLGPFSGWFVFLGVMGILMAIPFMMKILIDWYFAITTIAVEDVNVWDSFRRSAYLVSGGWWRVLGIVLLMGIITQFAISLILTPVNFFALFGFFSKYMRMMTSLGPGAADPAAAADMLKSMGLGLGLASALGQYMAILVSPIVTTVLYFDLRARKGEFSEPPAADETPIIIQ